MFAGSCFPVSQPTVWEHCSFTARRYASVVYAVVVCPSVHPSVSHNTVVCRNNWTNQAVFLPWRLPSTYPTLYCKESWVSAKIRALFSGHRKFTMACLKSCCQRNSSSSVKLVDNTYATFSESWLFTASQWTVTLWLWYFDLLWICCTTCFYSWQDFNWHSTSTQSICGSRASC